MSFEQPQTATLPRRLAAMLYDAFLVAALWIVTTAAIFAFRVTFMNEAQPLGGFGFQLFLYVEGGAFFAYFWHVKGQTLGMQVWKIRTVNDSGQIMTLSECAVRYFFATFSLFFMGLGYLWILFDPEKLAWHDRASGTRVEFLGKDAYKQDKTTATKTKGEANDD